MHLKLDGDGRISSRERQNNTASHLPPGGASGNPLGFGDTAPKTTTKARAMQKDLSAVPPGWRLGPIVSLRGGGGDPSEELGHLLL